MDASTQTDERVVYGARCVWWDGIEKVGKITASNGASLPCCPHCRGMLFEIPTPTEWWASVEKHQKNGHPGYREFVEWLKGKCFPTIDAAKATYEAKPGRTVTL